jgi:1-acyl-sn-glycerol-3-phosphate acyltransferase
MWSASVAPPERSSARAVWLVRLTALLGQVGRMWVGSWFFASLDSPADRARRVRRWARAVLRTLRVEVRVSGSPPCPCEALLLVANHVSWLDSYAINSIDGTRFVAKREVAAWPFIGAIARRVGTIFIKRGCFRSAARTVSVMAAALGKGQSVAAFPEATTSDGRSLRRFFPAMFQAAVLTGARVQPLAIRYCDAAGAPTAAAAFIGDMSVADSLHLLLREPRLTVELTFCPPIDPTGSTRRQLAQQSRAAIAEALELEHDPEQLPVPFPYAA